MSEHSNTLLGKPVEYISTYQPDLLQPIARQTNRSSLGIDEQRLPFIGIDIWNAYELSWLDSRGKPRVAIAEFLFPVISPNLIESKSFKLYLNSLNQSHFENSDALRQTLIKDLSAAAGASVGVIVSALNANALPAVAQLEGILIDDLPLRIDYYGPPNPAFLSSDEEVVAETLLSHLLRSNCPVTGQPDWATLQISYRGPKIDRGGLLRYICSYREHSDFHEACVERIFTDIANYCAPQALSVYARYTRRGGLDINPFRATSGMAMPDNVKLLRQ